MRLLSDWLTNLIRIPPSLQIVRDRSLFASLMRESEQVEREREYAFSRTLCTYEEALIRSAARSEFWAGYQEAMLNSYEYCGEESILPAFTVRAGEFEWGGKAGTGYATAFGIVSFI